MKGVLTNLLENAAQAVEPGGVVLGVTAAASGQGGDRSSRLRPGSELASAARCSSRPSRSNAAAWAWGSPSRARARCCLAATSCWWKANWEERPSVSCFRLRSLLCPLLRDVTASAQDAGLPRSGAPGDCAHFRHRSARQLHQWLAAATSRSTTTTSRSRSTKTPISCRSRGGSDSGQQCRSNRSAPNPQLGPLLGALVVGEGGEAAILTFNQKVEADSGFHRRSGPSTRTCASSNFRTGTAI